MSQRGCRKRARAARTADGVLGALAGYGRLLRDRSFVGYALAGGCAQGGLFAYIAGSPSTFIEFFGVPATVYGWLFGANALGLFPNSTALALAEQGRRAGSAAALFGTLQYSVAACASACVAWLHDGTPWPMAAGVAVCGVLAWSARRFIVPAGSAPQVSVVEPLD